MAFRPVKNVILLVTLILFAGCNSLSVDTLASDDIVATIVAHTLEAYVPPVTVISITATADLAEGPSVVVTQSAEGHVENKEIAGDGLPEFHYIWNIWGHRQYFGLGCEASAVVDWADYYDVTVSEYAFQMRLPLSDNPDLGFVGSVDGPWGQVPPYAYGVHAAPIAFVLREYYGMNAVGKKNLMIEDLKRELASDQPVIAWVIGNCVGGIPHEYIDQEGTPVPVAAYEHVVILTGYNAESIRYMNNGRFYDIPYDNFANTWGVLGNMAVYLAD